MVCVVILCYSCPRLLASASHLGQMPHADSVLWWAPTCSTVLLARIIDLTWHCNGNFAVWHWHPPTKSASHLWFHVPAQHRKMTSPANLLGHLMAQQWRSHNTPKLLKTPDTEICSDKRQAVQMQSDSVWVVEPQLLYLEAERKLKTAASTCKANAKENSAWINAEPKQRRFWERNWVSKGDHWEPFAIGVLTVGCNKNASVALSAPSLLW